MVDYFVFGLNHQTATVGLRERLCFSDSEILRVIPMIVKRSAVNSLMILSTCNRVEFIGTCSETEKIIDVLTHFLTQSKLVTTTELSEKMYFYTNDQAIHHLFRVAASLDSMVIGEPQILGQLKKAMKMAQQAGSVDRLLRAVVERSYRVAKKVRSQTGIAKNGVSISYVAAERVRKILGSLRSRNILIIGSGKMSSLAVQHLSRGQQLGELYVTSRTEANARLMADRFNGRVIPYESFKDYLPHIDIIISSTSASHYILHSDDVKRMMESRQERPLFCIDIAVPRDIDPDIKEIHNVYLDDIDDLKQVILENVQKRENEADKAEDMVCKEVEKCKQQVLAEMVKPTIISLRNGLEQLRQDELKRHDSELFKLSAHDKKLVESITKSLINRVLHVPLCSLKSDMMHQEVLPPLEVVEKVFGLNETTSAVCYDE